MNKQTYYYAIVFLFVFGLISVGGAAKDLPVSSLWLSAPVNIDGSSDDWADGTLSNQEKLNIDFSFKNNGDTLFVLFKFNDRKFMSSVNQTGMTIWFNTSGKKKKQYGILFRQQSIPAQNYIEYLEKQGQPLSEDKKKELLERKNIQFYNTYVVDKKGKTVGPPQAGTEYKPAFFRVKSEAKLSTYEFAVPLARSENTLPGVGVDSGAPVTIGFEWGGMTEELRKRNLERQAQSGGRGGGAGEVGFSNSNRGMVPREGSGPKKHNFWVDVLLAGK